MAVDDRIVCAAPSCYITTMEKLLTTLGPQDAEQNIVGQIAFGMDHADYLMLRAPKPTLICAATRDYFDITGTWETFRQAKRFYERLGFPERVDLATAAAAVRRPFNPVERLFFRAARIDGFLRLYGNGPLGT